MDFKIDERMGIKVLTLNGKLIPGTTNKSPEFYQGFMNGYSRAIAIQEERPDIKATRKEGE